MDGTGVRAKRQLSVEVKEVAQARCCQTREKISPAANMGSLTAQIRALESKAKSRHLSGPGHFKLISSSPS